jgi:MFS family permease
VEEGAARGQSVSRLNVLIAITAAIIGLIYGYDLGSIASALLFLVPAFDLSTFMTSVVTSAVVLGQLFGALFAGRISNTIGRKRSLVLVALGYAAFAGLQGLAPNEWFLTVVRFLLGLAIGISIVVAPAYIAESAPVGVRGSMLVTFQIATTSGIAIAYFVGAALAPTESWRLILSLSAIPAVIVLVLIVRLPDTARWLLMNGQREEEADLLGGSVTFGIFLRPGAGLVRLRLRTRSRDQGSTTGGHPHLLVQRRPLARGVAHVISLQTHLSPGANIRC